MRSLLIALALVFGVKLGWLPVAGWECSVSHSGDRVAVAIGRRKHVPRFRFVDWERALRRDGRWFEGWLRRERYRLLDAYRNDLALGLSNARVEPQLHQVSVALRALEKSRPATSPIAIVRK